MDEKAGVIESPFFRATLDAKRGRIASLIDKRTGRELVDAAAPQGFGQYFYERFGYKELVDWTAKSLVSAVCGAQDDLLRLRHAARRRLQLGPAGEHVAGGEEDRRST